MTDQKHTISMRLIVTVATVLLMTIAVTSVGVVSERHTRNTLSHEIETRLRIQARSLAQMSSSALLGGFPELTLHPLVKEMQAEMPELAYVLVLNHQGLIQGHSDARRLGQPYKLDSSLQILHESDAESGEQLLGDEQVIVALAPVRHPNGQRIGTALVGLQRSYITEMVAAVRTKQLLSVLVMIGAGVVMAMVLMSKLMRPIGALREGLERIGRGDMNTPIKIRGRTELGMLARTINQMAGELKQAQVQMVEKERLTREMDLAREIQRHLLPAQGIERNGYRLAGSHRAAFEVGGDYYDFFPLPGDRIGLAIADVSGKGLAGCMIMSMLSTLLRSRRNDFDSPSALLVNLEEELRGALKRGQFITLFYGILDTKRHKMTYASAAHCPVLVYRAADGGIEWQRTKGIPIGALPGGALGRSLKDIELTLAEGDILLQYTDGINEAFNKDDDQFDFDRIEACVKASASRGPETVLNALKAAVSDWSGEGLPSDDETLLVVGRDRQAAPERKAAPAGGGDEARRLVEAESRGWHLELHASLKNLSLLHDWLASCPDLLDLPVEEARLVESALYEVCANIVEHGCGKDERQKLNLWWVPSEPANPAPRKSACAGASSALSGGYFLLRDRGLPFQVDGYKQVDFNDPAVRRRGRGLGLDMIHRIVSQISFHPDAAAGNLTVLQFSCELHSHEKESIDA